MLAWQIAEAMKAQNPLENALRTHEEQAEANSAAFSPGPRKRDIQRSARLVGRALWARVGLMPRSRRTSGPIPKFASAPVTFRCELRNLRTTSNFMILVRF